MALYITSLNSGSNANCYYIGDNDNAVLIDAGLSCRETEKRMKLLGLSMNNVKAIFISHEHSDHINGIENISKKYQLPVYITESTFKNCYVSIASHLRRSFLHNNNITIGGLSVIAFKKSHDATDPHSFMISSNGINIGIITDIGYACEEVISYFSSCHAAFLESNYCEEMLANGSYPFHLKKRISGKQGHLSNTQALELFTKYRSKNLQLLILSHLSKNNNTAEKVAALFQPHAGNTKIVVASRYESTALFCIETLVPVVSYVNKRIGKNKDQLSLF
jgi:phosphoribosyl 1,2-cyclic phosphodiesterase